LLQDVNKLVGEQPSPGYSSGCVLSFIEKDIATESKGAGMQQCGQRSGDRPSVNPHVTETGVKLCFEEAANRWLQGCCFSLAKQIA